MTIIGTVPAEDRTPQATFKIPILQALISLGGEAPKGEILDFIESNNLVALKPGDKVFMPNRPNEQYWRNAASWERVVLIREGLLSDYAPYGIWKITQQGKDYLQTMQNQLTFL